MNYDLTPEDIDARMAIVDEALQSIQETNRINLRLRKEVANLTAALEFCRTPDIAVWNSISLEARLLAINAIVNEALTKNGHQQPPTQQT